MNVDITPIVEELKTDLTVKLSSDPMFNADVLNVIVKTVVREVIQRRDYPESLDDKQIELDLYNYYSTMLRLAEYDYNQIGIEGQISHSENGINRQYTDRNKYFNDVYKFVRFLV